MNGKALIPLVAGLGIGGFALWMGVQTLRSVKGAQKPAEHTPVWAAKETIPRGTEITEEMVVSLPFPKSLVPAGAITKKEDLVARVPSVDAPAGLPILDTMLFPPGVRSGLHVKPGYRAVAVKIDESSGVDYHLQPGSFVDVVGSFQTRRNNKNETVARTIVENVEIGAVGPRISAAAGKDEGEKSGTRSVRAVTLFVKPEEVPKLLLAEQKGKIKLSLRSDTTPSDEAAPAKPVSDLELTGDTPREESPKEGPGAFIDQIRKLLMPASPPTASNVPAAPPPPVVVEVPADTWEVVVVRGDDRKAIRFKNRSSREIVSSEESESRPSLFGNPPRKPAAEPPPSDATAGDAPPTDEDGGPDQPPQEAQG